MGEEAGAENNATFQLNFKSLNNTIKGLVVLEVIVMQVSYWINKYCKLFVIYLFFLDSFNAENQKVCHSLVSKSSCHGHSQVIQWADRDLLNEVYLCSLSPCWGSF